MRVDAFCYEVPPELIAQRPAEHREHARVMVLPAGEAAPAEHHNVSDLPRLLPAGSLVVVNDTRVLNARLLGRRLGTGGRVELLLVRRVGSCAVETSDGLQRTAQTWLALGKAKGSLTVGEDIEMRARGREPAGLFARLLGRGRDGLLEIALWTSSEKRIDAAIDENGHVPLPPYIKREDTPDDVARYQTVFARHDGAVAAPTAGLHFTEALMERLAATGCEVATITLHVGLGTFRPVTVEDLDDHPMHAEHFVVSQTTAEAVANARARSAPIVAIGTTSARALESAADLDRPGHVRPARGETRLLIQPGYVWRVVDGLFTNFHVPRSTLMALVCALGGRERVLDAYRLAVRERYRFFSYGDAMLLWRMRA